MFTKVWHWLALLVFGPVVAGIIAMTAFSLYPKGGAGAETAVLFAAFVALGVPFIAAKGAWSTFKEGWNERVRMNARDRRYGQRRGAW
jgi:hypothetical protein